MVWRLYVSDIAPSSRGTSRALNSSPTTYLDARHRVVLLVLQAVVQDLPEAGQPVWHGQQDEVHHDNALAHPDPAVGVTRATGWQQGLC